MPRSSLSNDDEVVSIGDSGAAIEVANESTEQESIGTKDYEKPSWFRNLQPGLLPLRLLV